MEPASEDEAFQYPIFEDAAKQIRLLHIQSDDKDASLTCTLKVYPLVEQDAEKPSARSIPAYRAISYTWGDQKPSEGISINGVHCLVTRNCWEALWQTRLHQATVADDDRASIDGDVMPVFIDAICINQADPREKGTQVQSMGRIFDCAYETLICPGWEGKDSKLLFDGFNEMTELIQMIRYAEVYFHIESGENIGRVLRNYKRATFTRADVLKNLLDRWNRDTVKSWVGEFWLFANRPYWTRAWVIQEILPKKRRRIICDSVLIDFENIKSIIEHFRYIKAAWAYQAGLAGQSFSDLADMSSSEFEDATSRSAVFRALDRASEGVNPLAENYPSFATSPVREWQMEQLGCKEPRDRVYCLLRLLPWRTCRGPPPCNYETSLTQVILDTFQNLYVGEIFQPFKVILRLLSWLELDAVDLVSDPRLCLNKLKSASDLSSPVSNQSLDATCPGVHVSSQSAGPISLSTYWPVIRNKHGKLAIFTYAVKSDHLSFSTAHRRNLSTNQDFKSMEVQYSDGPEQQSLVNFDMAVVVEEGDIFAVIQPGTPKQPGRDRSYGEAWVLRKAHGQIYEILACGQLRNFLKENARSGFDEMGFNFPPRDEKLNRTDSLRQEFHQRRLELHLDPEDTLRYAAIHSRIAFSDLIPSVFEEVRHSYSTNGRQFGRARFSSFATLRTNDKQGDDDINVCIHCGIRLGQCVHDN